MRFVIQRVSSASVTIDGKVRGEIGKGFVVLIGIGEDDTKEIADKLLHKLLNMRIFEDRKWENKSCPKRCVRRTAYDFPVHLICQLQKGKSSIFYRRRQTGDGRADV